MNSRLIIKNIPTNISENKIRNIFSSQGEITDVRLVIKNG